MSKSEIRFKPDQQSLQFSIHLFLDDIENALSLYNNNELHLCTPQESEQAENILAQYIQRKLEIKIDDNIIQLEYIGKESADNMMAVWCYFEISNIATFNSFEINNLLLHDLFDDQQNIMAYYVNKKNVSFDVYDKNNTVLSIKEE